MAFDLAKNWYRYPLATMDFLTKKFPNNPEIMPSVHSMINHSSFYGFFSNTKKMNIERAILQHTINATVQNEVLVNPDAEALAEYYFDELAREDFFDDFKLKLGYIILTDKCEINCIDCGNSSLPKGKSNLDFSRLEGFLQRNNEKISKEPISLSGGDIFEYKHSGHDVSDVASLLGEYGFKSLAISTGGIHPNNAKKINAVKKFYSAAKSENINIESFISLTPFSPRTLDKNGEINKKTFESYLDMIRGTINILGEHKNELGTMFMLIRHGGNLLKELDDAYHKIASEFKNIIFLYDERETLLLGRAINLQNKTGISPPYSNTCSVLSHPSGFSILYDGTLTPCSSLLSIGAPKFLQLEDDMRAVPKLFHEYCKSRYDKMLEENFAANMCRVCTGK
jgi:hypothetical protein